MTLSRPEIAATAFSIALLCGACPAAAQTTENVRQLAPTAWLLEGTSGNVVIVPDERGVLLIDDERPTDLAEMTAAARTLSPGPIRYVINTHWHVDHSGGNAELAAAGAVIIAHRAVRTRLSVDQYMAAYDRTVPASPDIALPGVVFDDALDVHFGGETVKLRHTPSAHTDGDSLVYLEKANVLHMGDVFFNGLFPFIDRSSGGSIQGLIRSVDVALSIADDKTQIVPAHGDVANRTELAAYRAMLTDVRDQVQAAIASGETLDAVRQRRPTAPYRLGGDADRFVAAVYDSLSSPAAAAAPRAQGAAGPTPSPTDAAHCCIN